MQELPVQGSSMLCGAEPDSSANSRRTISMFSHPFCPYSGRPKSGKKGEGCSSFWRHTAPRFLRGRGSEEHTSELQSPCNLVCRLLLEKKKTRSCRETSVSAHCRGISRR